jgi:L-ascorbate 6-phosphate lactonase
LQRYKSGNELIREIHETELSYGQIAIWSLGQAGIIIKGNEQTGFLSVDPYLTYAIETQNPVTEFKRVFSPPLEPEQLKGINGVLVTHFHDDHLDPYTLLPLANVSPETKIAVPASHTHLLQPQPSNLQLVKDRTAFTISGFEITAIAVAHTEYEKDSQGNDFYFGYLIECNGVRIFHSGDTVVTNRLIEEVAAFQPHIALLPINGVDYFRTARGIVGNMNYRDAVEFGVAIGADLIIPIHYDLFPNNRENPAYFVDYLLHTYPTQRFHMMTAGERFIYFQS